MRLTLSEMGDERSTNKCSLALALNARGYTNVCVIDQRCEAATHEMRKVRGNVWMQALHLRKKRAEINYENSIVYATDPNGRDVVHHYLAHQQPKFLKIGNLVGHKPHHVEILFRYVVKQSRKTMPFFSGLFSTPEVA